MNEHRTRAVIEPALVSTVGGRLHHYALASPLSGVPTFGPPQTEPRFLVPTTTLLSAARARPMTLLPAVTHPSWKTRFNGETLTRMVLRLPDDLLLGLALSGRFKEQSALRLAAEIEEVIRELRKSLTDLGSTAAHSLQPPASFAFEELG
jgi:hypothetical protein